VGVCGGIILAWDLDHIQAEGVTLKEFSLTATITMRLTNISFLITVVYGPTADADKPRFVAELNELKPSDGQLWLCLRDFKLIYIRLKTRIIRTSTAGSWECSEEH
jgi:hypothetical protein